MNWSRIHAHAELYNDATWRMLQARAANACEAEVRSADLEHRPPRTTEAMRRAINAIPNHPELYAAGLEAGTASAWIHGDSSEAAELRAENRLWHDDVIAGNKADAERERWEVPWPHTLPPPGFHRAVSAPTSAATSGPTLY